MARAAARATRERRGPPGERRRRALARADDAAPDPGGAPRRRDRDPRPARPPPRRAGREFLAVPPLHLRRAGAARRLAPLGARRSSLCARAGMGGRAHGLDLARPLALDGVRLDAGARHQARPRAGGGASRWPRCWCRAASASALPGLMRPTGSRNVIEQMAQAIVHDAASARACRRPSRPSPLVRDRRCCRTSGARSPKCGSTIAQLSGERRARPRRADRRSGRRDISLFGPRRVRRAGRRRPHHRRPRRDLARRLSARCRAPSRRDPRRDRPARLELRHPPHRPAGERTAAGAARAHGRAPAPRRSPARATRAARAGGRHDRRGCRSASPNRSCCSGCSRLPVLWWLLRLMPPRPRRIEFPPTRLLFEIAPQRGDAARARRGGYAAAADAGGAGHHRRRRADVESAGRDVDRAAPLADPDRRRLGRGRDLGRAPAHRRRA